MDDVTALDGDLEDDGDNDGVATASDRCPPSVGSSSSSSRNRTNDDDNSCSAHTQRLKWFCEAGGGGSPDEARLEQTPYPF